MTRADLEAYQRALAAALVEADDPVDVRARLLADPACAPLHDYISTLEPRFLEIMMVLARRWAVRSGEPW